MKCNYYDDFLTKKLLTILLFVGIMTKGLACPLNPPETIAVISPTDYSLAKSTKEIERLYDCGVPTNLNATNITSTSANLSWDAIAIGNAVMYQYCIVEDETPVPGPTTTDLFGSSYQPLQPNISYNFFVRAMCDGGVWGDWSEAANFTTSGNCGIPSNLNVTNITSTSVDLSWDAISTGNAVMYQYCIVEDETPVLGPTTTDLFGSSYQPLQPNISYNFFVRAMCDGGVWGDWSEAANFTTSGNCGIPSNLNVTNITSTSADLSWDAISTGNAVMYQYCIVEDETPVPGPTTTDLFGSSYQPLQPNISYNFFVRAMCDGGVWGDWSEAENFTTSLECDVVSSLNEGFEEGELPDCWSIINNGDNGEWFINGQSSNTGSYSAEIDFTPDEQHDDYLVTPQVSITNGISDYLTFYAKNELEGSNADQLNVLISTTGNEASDFTIILDGPIEPSTSWTSYQYDLSAYEGQNVYIAFQDITNGGFVLFLDDIRVQSHCLAPTDVTIDNITGTSADVSWTASGSETEWEIIYGETGFNPDTEGTTVTDDDGEIGETLSSLTPGTYYDIYVRAICGEDDNSSLSNPAILATAPANDDLCNAIALTIDGECTGGVYSNESSTIQENEPTDPSCWYASFDPHTVWFSFEAPESGNVTITTDIAGGTLIDTHIAIYEAPADCADLTTLSIVGCSEDDGEIVDSDKAVASLTDLTVGATYYIQVGGYSHDVGTFCVEVQDDGSCLPPSNIMFNNITPSSANVTWAANNGESEWEIIYGYSGFDPISEGTSITNTDNSFSQTLSDLDAGTDYDVYIRAICGVDSQSELAGPEVLTTAPANDDLCNAIGLTIDGECSGSYSNINASMEANEPQGSCFGNSGSNTVWFSFVAPSSGNVTVTTDIEGATLTNSEIAVYEAPTDCGDFSTIGDEVGCDQDSGNDVPYNSIVDLTGLTAGETYYVQVNGNYDNDGDFCIEVQDNGVCLTPSGITLDNVTQTSVDVSWTAGGSETEWEIVYGEEGFDPENEGTTVTDDDGELGETLTDLIGGTSYDVYVRAICGPDSESEFVGPENFSTAPVNDNLCDATALTIDEECTGSSYTNVLATLQSDEPLPDCWSNTNSPKTVWFSFVAPNSGNVVVTTDFADDIGSSSLYYKQAAVYAAPADCADLSTLGEPLDCADQNGGPNSDYSAVITLGGLTAGDTYYVQVDGSGSDTGTFCIEVQDNGGCVTPSNITFENVGYDSVDVSWTSNGGETEWEIIYGPEGFDPLTEGTTVTDSDAEAGITLTDLDSETEYDVYVRAICGSEDESEMAGPEQFTTEVAPPANDYLCNATVLTLDEECSGATYSNENATQQSNEPVPDCWIVGNATPQTVWFSFTAPDSGNVTITPNSDNGSLNYNPHIAVYEAASDCNDLSTLGDPLICGEDVGSNTSSIVSLIELVPGDTYYIQVDSYGFEEGTFCIEVQDDGIICYSVTNLTYNNVSDTSAEINWTSNGDETEWEVVYGEEGFDPETEGTTITDNDDEPGITLEDLDPETTYHVYVRANCGDGNMSDLNGPIQFTTLLPCNMPTDISIINITSTTVDISWTAGGDETEWQIIYGPEGFDPETGGITITDTDGEAGITLENLDPDTSYDVYVIAICDTENFSEAAGPESFNTTLSVDEYLFNSFTYYPNPVQGRLTMKAEKIIAQVEIYNLLGQKVINIEPNTFEAQLKTGNLQTGIYLMKVKIGSSEKTFKIVKN